VAVAASNLLNPLSLHFHQQCGSYRQAKGQQAQQLTTPPTKLTSALSARVKIHLSEFAPSFFMFTLHHGSTFRLD
jgi:hypothetical protein